MKEKKKKYNLEDLIVNIVSLVDYPANQRMFLVMKNADGGIMNDKLKGLVKKGLITEDDAKLIMAKSSDGDKSEDIVKTAKEAIESLNTLVAAIKKDEDSADNSDDKDKSADDDSKSDDKDKDSDNKSDDKEDKSDDKSGDSDKDDKKEDDKKEDNTDKKDEKKDEKKKDDDDKSDDKKDESDDKKEDSDDKKDEDKDSSNEKEELKKSIEKLHSEIAELKEVLNTSTGKDLQKEEIKKYEELPAAGRFGVLLKEIHKVS